MEGILRVVLPVLAFPILVHAAPVSVQCSVEGPVYEGKLDVEDVRNWDFSCQKVESEVVNWTLTHPSTLSISFSGLYYVNSQPVAAKGKAWKWTCQQIENEVRQFGLQSEEIRPYFSEMKFRMLNQYGVPAVLSFSLPSDHFTFRSGTIKLPIAGNMETCLFVVREEP